MGPAPTLRHSTLALAERDGQRCAGPVLLGGFVFGLGVVELSRHVLGNANRESLDLLVLLVFQLFGPLLVSLLGMALLLPRWLERAERCGPDAWRQSGPAAALAGALLLVMFFIAAVVGGLLLSPAAGLSNALQDLLSGIQLHRLLRSILRSSLFMGLVCIWCQRRGLRELKRGRSPALIVSNQLLEGLILNLVLKLLWVLGLNALQGGGTGP